MDIENRHFIVTGGAGSLGSRISDALAKQGARVSVFDFDDEGLGGMQESGFVAIKCDLTQPEQIQDAVKKAVEENGKIDGLINNAGVLYSEPLVSLQADGIKKHEVQSWDKMIAINLSAAFYITREVVEQMFRNRTKGIVLNISSVVANGNAGQSAYAAAKAGIESLTVTWAREVGPMGIRVVAVAPGYIDVESTHDAIRPDIVKHVVESTPLRRLGKQSEVVEAIVSLIQNDYINATTVPVTGGLIL